MGHVGTLESATAERIRARERKAEKRRGCEWTRRIDGRCDVRGRFGAMHIGHWSAVWSRRVERKAEATEIKYPS